MEIVEVDERTGGPTRLAGEYVRDDLDLASPGIVKILDSPGETYPDLPWDPRPPSPPSPSTERGYPAPECLLWTASTLVWPRDRAGS
jgi:hypothetical protein